MGSICNTFSKVEVKDSESKKIKTMARFEPEILLLTSMMSQPLGHQHVITNICNLLDI